MEQNKTIGGCVAPMAFLKIQHAEKDWELIKFKLKMKTKINLINNK